MLHEQVMVALQNAKMRMVDPQMGFLNLNFFLVKCTENVPQGISTDLLFTCVCMNF